MREISYLISNGHLKELLGRMNLKSKDSDQDLAKIMQKVVSPLRDCEIINFISGGSNFYDITYSAANRHAMFQRWKKKRAQETT